MRENIEIHDPSTMHGIAITPIYMTRRQSVKLVVHLGLVFNWTPCT